MGTHNKSSLIGNLFFLNLSCKFAGGCRLIGPEEIRGRLLIIYSFITSIGRKIRKKFCLTKEGLLSRPIAIACAIASFLYVVCALASTNFELHSVESRCLVIAWALINILKFNFYSTILLFLS